MHSWINRLLFISLVVLFFSPKNMPPLLLSLSEPKLFELHSLPHGNLTFLGDSHVKYNEIALTKDGIGNNASRSAGAVLYNHPISFLDPHSKQVHSFYTMFAFSIQNIPGDEGAFGDGLAFLISPDDNLLGSPGYLGLVDSADLTRNRFIAIEFDTKRDSLFHDPDDNHVGLDINNLFSVKLATSSSLGVNLKSGNLIITWIDYRSNEKRLEVFLSKSYLKPTTPLLKVDIDLSDYLKEKMFVGFCAATEGSMQVTHIDQWEFTMVRFSPPPPPSPPESRTTFTNPAGSVHRHSNISKFAIGLTIAVCSISFLLIFGWFCWKNLIWLIHKSEQTNSLELQTIRSSRVISPLEIQLSILVAEVARGLNIVKVLDNERELTRMKTVKSSIPLCNSLRTVKPSILPLGNGLPLRTNDITSVDDQ